MSPVPCKILAQGGVRLSNYTEKPSSVPTPPVLARWRSVRYHNRRTYCARMEVTTAGTSGEDAGKTAAAY